MKFFSRVYYYYLIGGSTAGFGLGPRFRARNPSAASICAMHLSRLAEEIVPWATPQFGFVRLSDAFSTGSIMPQKRNPDAAELVRGKAGRVFGALQAMLTMMKGLPLTYSKDMQEDKEGTFDALQTLSLCLAAMAGMVRDMEPDLEGDEEGGRPRLRHRHRSRRTGWCGC